MWDIIPAIIEAIVRSIKVIFGTDKPIEKEQGHAKIGESLTPAERADLARLLHLGANDKGTDDVHKDD